MLCSLQRIAVLFCLVAASTTSAAPLFADDSLVEVELVGPLRTLLAAKNAGNESDFTLKADGVEYAIGVRLRGKSRLRVCSFPPLRLNFTRKDTGGTLFAGQNKLKLVTHCRDRDRYEQDVLEEYAAYRIFSLISDVSYSVRPLTITYTDTDVGEEKSRQTHFGFLIEAKSALARRTGGELVRIPGVTLSSLNARQITAVYVFQYLIGNTDWSLVTAYDEQNCCHNGSLLRIDEQLFYVPYDFDLAGIVNARYAKPDASLGIKRVTQRRYRGHCTSRESLQEALARIKALHGDILAISEGIAEISVKDAQRRHKFLQAFFTAAEDEEKLLNAFERRCR